MMRQRIALAAALLAGLLALGPPAGGRLAAGEPQPGEYALVFHQGAPYVELTLGPARGLFLLDTGANTTGVDGAWLRGGAVPHRPAAPTTLGGTTGDLAVSQVVVDRLDLGTGFFRDPLLVVQDFSAFQHPPEGPQVGILGTDLLNCYRLDLDYGARRARLALRHERRPLPGHLRPATVAYERGIPTPTVRLAGLDFPCRLDSGNAWSDPRPLLDVNRRVVATLAQAGVELEPAGTVYVAGIAGGRRLELLRGRGPGLTLELGPARLDDVVLAVHDEGTLDEPRPLTLAGSGVLSRLERLVIDPFDGLLWLPPVRRWGPL